jgi:hypothetical protein
MGFFDVFENKKGRMKKPMAGVKGTQLKIDGLPMSFTISSMADPCFESVAPFTNLMRLDITKGEGDGASGNHEPI